MIDSKAKVKEAGIIDKLICFELAFLHIPLVTTDLSDLAYYPYPLPLPFGVSHPFFLPFLSVSCIIKLSKPNLS